MKYILYLLIVLTGAQRVSSQSFSLKVRIDGFDGNRVYLSSFREDETIKMDSAACLKGEFRLSFPAGTKPGIYRLMLGPEGSSNLFEKDPEYFDIVFNNEDIQLETSINALIDSMKVIVSKENDIFYRFLKSNSHTQAKLNRLSSLFAVYKPEDMFYKALNDEFVSVQKYFNSNAEILANELPGSITSSVINVSLFPVVESVRSTGDIRFSIREHYFDLMIIEDPRLINSPYITNLIMEYLGLYREPDFNQSQQEENFIIAIDRIMDAVSGNPEIYDYVLNFLVDGFQRFQMEKVLVHIAENFISGDCEAQSKKLLQKRLEGYERMAEGKKVPDIRIENQDGNMVSLYDLRYDYLLVVFWASWCPHCSVFLNQLKRWYPEKELDLQVFAVSIDSSKFDWEEKSLEENYPWINTYSDEGWEGKAARDFNVYATPTLFLLDKEFRILAKPLTFREFKKETDDIVKEERN